MKTEKSADHPVAIPTTFNGIEFKSRLEAQTAFSVLKPSASNGSMNPKV